MSKSKFAGSVLGVAGGLVIATVLFIAAALPERAMASTLRGISVSESSLAALPRDERQVLLAMNAILEARLDDAEQRLQTVLARRPHFHLARLVYADVLLAQSGAAVNFSGGTAARRVAALLEEARVRLAHARSVVADERMPSNLIALAPSTPRVVVVDVNAARLYLYENSARGPRLVRNVYVSTAKNGAGKRREGDQRTPVGVYFITGEIDPSSLPDFYGAGALPVNYPNEWDLLQGRTGYGIWLHGVPTDTFARAPRASDGCVALSNDYMSELLSMSDMEGTPVVFADSVMWLSHTELLRRQDELIDLLSRWRDDWESRDPSRFAQHYSQDFRSERGGRDEWLRHKQRVNRAKRFIRVNIENVNAFSYPGESGVVVVELDQDYMSSNYSGRLRKR